MAARNGVTAPPAVRNFRMPLGAGDCSQRARKSAAEPPFSGDQTAARFAVSPLRAAPKTRFRRRIGQEHGAAGVDQQRRPRRVLQTEYDFRLHQSCEHQTTTLNPPNIKLHQRASVNAAGKSSSHRELRIVSRSSLSATNTLACRRIFRQQLPARAARHRPAGPPRHHRDGDKFFLSVRQRLEQRDRSAQQVRP